MISFDANTSSDTWPVSWPMRRATASTRARDTRVRESLDERKHWHNFC